jgi:phytoene desaturase
MKENRKALIIGAGLGGLATALRLASKGYEVEIVEKYHQSGGRLNQLRKDGFTFDVGPSFFSMSYEFKKLFDYCRIKNPLRLNELNPLYAVYFEGKEKPYLIHKNLKKLEQEFADVENNLVAKTEKYLVAAGKLFHDSIDKVVRRNFNSKLDYFLSLATVPLLHSPKMFRSLWRELEMNFDSQEVKVIFSLVAFFLGSTPFQTPAVYSLLNYTELKHDGYWNVQGGMYKIVEQMEKLLKERKVTFHFNSEISQVRGCPDSYREKVRSVVDRNGKEFFADIFICNSDAARFRGKVLGRKNFTENKLDKMDWTLAPFTVYLGVKGKCENLHHHNYFLGNNFKEYAGTIFTKSVSPEKPYYYVNVSSRSNVQCAPDGCENIFILCPVPDLRYKKNWDDSGPLADTIISDLSKRINFDLHKNTLTKTIMNPIDWQNSFNLYRGSGLGLAHGFNQVGAFRPKNKDENFSNLYYVGASTTPGTGLPMVVISSKLTVERILEDSLKFKVQGF